MGTGILAISVSIAPVAVPLGPLIAKSLWAGDVVLFSILTAFWLAKAVRDRGAVFAPLRDPMKAQSWGAPPMACFTLAVGFLKVGEGFLPGAACVHAAQVLFAVGVAGSIFSVSVVPYLMFTHHDITQDQTVGSWLMPVVPSVVASVPAALLVPTLPEAMRGDILAGGYALLGTGIALAAIIIVLFYSRLLYHKVPSGALVATTWLVVGPLGQSIAGIIALGAAADAVWPEYGHGLVLTGLAYGVLVWGFAMYWLAMAIALTIRAVVMNLPFDLSWWAFTFPVGVLTAGTDALYGVTRTSIFEIASVALLALLAATWSLVTARTLRTMVVQAAAGLEPIQPPVVLQGSKIAL
jgi:C4-dicarboxylate transporter/malic acid transport protein